MDTIGGRLKKFRDSITIDQAKFCKEIGVSRNTLSRWERGKSYPPADFLAVIHEKFEVSIEWLVTGKGGMKGWPHGIKIVPGDKAIHIMRDSSVDPNTSGTDASFFAVYALPRFMSRSEIQLDSDRQSLIYEHLVCLLVELKNEELRLLVKLIEHWMESGEENHGYTVVDLADRPGR